MRSFHFFTPKINITTRLIEHRCKLIEHIFFHNEVYRDESHVEGGARKSEQNRWDHNKGGGGGNLLNESVINSNLYFILNNEISRQSTLATVTYYHQDPAKPVNTTFYTFHRLVYACVLGIQQPGNPLPLPQHQHTNTMKIRDAFMWHY